MIKSYCLLCACCFSQLLYCQDTEATDSTKAGLLPEVIVKAYEQNKKLHQVAAAVNYINSSSLSRFDNNSILTAINTTAGARMEERSPGSYRLNTRGSSLRSPFGVRNVKIYYNDIPFTDPGGNTYLNQLGFYNIESIEILKGPGSSLYGAGTGGVMLLQTNRQIKNLVDVQYTAGSYGLQNTSAAVSLGNDTLNSTVTYQRQTLSGYREQSTLKRNTIAWQINCRPTDKDRLSGSFFYGDLFYQTPGALTLTEYESNPKAARPRAGSNPGAGEANASINQKTFWGGLNYRKYFTAAWSYTTVLYGAATRLNNPAIRNYARNTQPHYGGRTYFSYKKTISHGEITWQTGAELQHGFTSSKVYTNKKGFPDSLLSDDEINIDSWFLFSQATLSYNKWILAAGGSFNRAHYDFIRLSAKPVNELNLAFKNQVAPRISLLRKINESLSVYADWSQGFSPPTAEELFPSGSLTNPGLTAEKGSAYEAGLKGFIANRRFSIDIAAFYFTLNNTIVQRRDAAGGDFYLNAGSTAQKGLETQLNYNVGKIKSQSEPHALLWANHTVYNFKYRHFTQLDKDYSGNCLPGVPSQFLSAGLDLFVKGLYLHLSYQHSSAIILNDAGTDRADPYTIFSSKIGITKKFSKISLEFFAGGDNLFNSKYSLGNDINAFGGRYYNAAPLRNFYSGFIFSY